MSRLEPRALSEPWALSHEKRTIRHASSIKHYGIMARWLCGDKYDVQEYKACPKKKEFTYYVFWKIVIAHGSWRRIRQTVLNHFPPLVFFILRTFQIPPTTIHQYHPLPSNTIHCHQKPSKIIKSQTIYAPATNSQFQIVSQIARKIVPLITNKKSCHK